MNDAHEIKDQILRFLQVEGSAQYSDSEKKRAGVATQSYSIYDILAQVNTGDIGILSKYLEDVDQDGYIEINEKKDIETGDGTFSLKDEIWWRITAQGIHFFLQEGGYTKQYEDQKMKEEENKNILEANRKKETKKYWTTIVLVGVLGPILAVIAGDIIQSRRTNNLQQEIINLNERIESIENSQSEYHGSFDSLMQEMNQLEFDSLESTN